MGAADPTYGFVGEITGPAIPIGRRSEPYNPCQSASPIRSSSLGWPP
jgi:hypothetical protein